MKKNLVIGLGTGRCGTVSLSLILDLQKNAVFSHESKAFLPWKFSETAILKKIKALLSKKGNFVGDVAFFYLPYVEYILANNPRAKFICLKRDKKETVESYSKKTKGRNHWMEHGGGKWKKDAQWDDCYPNYKTNFKERALEMYWEDYYGSIKKIMKKHPNNVLLLDMESINKLEGIKKILSFCGFPKKDWKLVYSIKKNQSDSLLKRIIKFLK
jgi:hypothetical protein